MHANQQTATWRDRNNYVKEKSLQRTQRPQCKRPCLCAVKSKVIISSCFVSSCVDVCCCYCRRCCFSPFISFLLLLFFAFSFHFHCVKINLFTRFWSRRFFAFFLCARFVAAFYCVQLNFDFACSRHTRFIEHISFCRYCFFVHFSFFLLCVASPNGH